jgi:cytosine/adenosine deaminase-related metal-dependent hydrolase
MAACFEAVTSVPAKILGLDGYGVAPGCHADFVLLEARDPVEAIRRRRRALPSCAAEDHCANAVRDDRARSSWRPSTTRYRSGT